ncbi:hypothetical protein Tco_0149233 [Tanacetum coccineum]
MEAIKKNNTLLRIHHVGGFGMSSDSSISNKPPLLPLPYAKSPVRKQLTHKEYEEKRAKNMCFYCDKKFVPGHKCKGQLFSPVVLPMKELEEEFKDPQEELNDVEMKNCHKFY